MKTTSGIILRICVGAAACVMLGVAGSPALAQSASLDLVPNTTERIEVGGQVEKIVVSNQEVADARPSDDGKSVLITALKQGVCEIRVIRNKDKDLIYSVRVRANLDDLAGEIRGLLSNVEGVTVKVIGSQVVLDGNVVTKSGNDRVMQIADAYKHLVLNLVKLDRTELNKYVAEAIDKDIGLKTVRVKVAGETATLEGLVFDEADKTMAVEKAQQHCTKVVNLLKVEEVMIETDVSFVMIDLGSETKTGFNILKTLSIDASVAATDRGASYSVAAGLKVALNALAADNKAKFIINPNLSTKSGTAGKFHSGGEQYFQVAGQVGGSLEKVEYGTILTVKPTLRGQDRIVNEILMQVSVPVSKPQGVFALDKYETSNTIMCKIGESIIISGLSQSLESQFGERTPVLGRLPIFSVFFSEKGKRRTNKELLVIVTPKPVFPSDASEKKAFSEERAKLLEETNTPQ